MLGFTEGMYKIECGVQQFSKPVGMGVMRPICTCWVWFVNIYSLARLVTVFDVRHSIKGFMHFPCFGSCAFEILS